ncbi:MAG: hypothetical protein IH788_02775, partial [Nitrospinae bacterium]|nr:hypothetical protein [Nitrospinota bacterium]
AKALALGLRPIVVLNKVDRPDAEPDRRQAMVEETGRQTVPQIFIDGHHVGGYDDLKALNDAGKLDEMLGTG